MIVVLEPTNIILIHYYKHKGVVRSFLRLHDFKNMKNYILLITFLVIQNLFSQQKKESFIGEIHVELKTVYEDKGAYSESVEKYLKLMDSIITEEYLNDPNGKYTSQYPSLDSYKSSSLMLMRITLDPNFTRQDRTKVKSYKYIFTDSTLSIKMPLISAQIVNKKTFEYQKYKQFNEDLVEVPVKYRFNEVPIEQTIIDKNDTRIIAGIKCYKVTVIQKGEHIVRHFYWNNIKDSKVITEMYVTDEISTYFNTIIKNRLILEKFYPMYVKRYSTAFKGAFLTSEVTKVEFEK